MRQVVHEDAWGVEVWLHHSWLRPLDGGKWWASRPGRFTPRYPLYTGGWVGPRACLDAVEHRKPVALDGKRTPAVQHVARRYTNWALTALTQITATLLLGALVTPRSGSRGLSVHPAACVTAGEPTHGFPLNVVLLQSCTKRCLVILHFLYIGHA
jgi:hypothetical protein